MTDMSTYEPRTPDTRANGGRPMERPNQQRTPQRRRKPGRNRTANGDIWRAPAPLPEVVPIEAPRDVGALLRSLGDPPIHGGTAIAHYVAAIAERAAAVAVAVARSADLLADDDPTTP